MSHWMVDAKEPTTHNEQLWTYKHDHAVSKIVTLSRRRNVKTVDVAPGTRIVITATALTASPPRFSKSWRFANLSPVHF